MSSHTHCWNPFLRNFEPLKYKYYFFFCSLLLILMGIMKALWTKSQIIVKSLHILVTSIYMYLSLYSSATWLTDLNKKTICSCLQVYAYSSVHVCLLRLSLVLCELDIGIFKVCPASMCRQRMKSTTTTTSNVLLAVPIKSNNTSIFKLCLKMLSQTCAI